MGLFDKKYCDICGEKIGFLGNRKLEDGNLCKTCGRKLSPFFTERRRSTVEDIRAQLIYREENARKLKDFRVGRTFGIDEKIYIDIENRWMIVTSADDWASDNPDIISLEQITAVETCIEDDKEELFYTDREGNEKSYNPPRYKHAYEFRVTFKIDSPWFDEISVDLNNGERPECVEDDRYIEWQMQMQELVSILRRVKSEPYRDLYNGTPDYYVMELRKKRMAEFSAYQDAPGPEKITFSQPSAVDGAWKCTACGTQNNGKFCMECGQPRT